MIEPLTIRNVALGAGMAKIAVPIVGRTRGEILDSAAALTALPVDLVEWRVDFYEALDAEAALAETLQRLREQLGDLPLLFALRTKREGGAAALSPARYAALVLTAARSGCADLVDVELSTPDVGALLDAVHASGVPAVGSRHDFAATPSQDEMIACLRRAQEAGADIPKLAVTPRSDADVLALLMAAAEWHAHGADRPFIAISMGTRGALSRVACALTGSCLTFGTAGRPSAPGQLPVAELRAMLRTLQTE